MKYVFRVVCVVVVVMVATSVTVVVATQDFQQTGWLEDKPPHVCGPHHHATSPLQRRARKAGTREVASSLGEKST